MTRRSAGAHGRTVSVTEAISVRADALGDGNQSLIAANKLIDALPGLVAEAAKGIAGSNFRVVSGTEGVIQVVAGGVGQGLSIYEALRQSLPAPHANGAVADGAAHVVMRTSERDGQDGAAPDGYVVDHLIRARRDALT